MVLYYFNISNLNIDEMKEYASLDCLEKLSTLTDYKEKEIVLAKNLLLDYGFKQLGVSNPIIKLSSNGKPYLSNGKRVSFNLSYSEDMIVLLISRLGVGVSIEYLNKDLNLDDFKDFFTADEFEYIQSDEDSIKTFYKLWVLKKSYLKMIDESNQVKPTDFIIKITPENQISLSHSKVFTGNIKFKLINIHDEYYLGTCSRLNVNEFIEITSEKLIN
ncbi:MAG: 4'-phosphopantetheinyl transferase superfamily protein [Methanobacteriaceae archaeon]|jgi:4'-phosphopantetheinyl transferase|nr:4'-phosphopantetheinyl transferase superfamily protein [Methanobacteriaceae archaeon]